MLGLRLLMLLAHAALQSRCTVIVRDRGKAAMFLKLCAYEQQYIGCNIRWQLT